MAIAYKPHEQPASEPPLILRGKLTSTSLAGEVVIVTGGGGGIGLEAARSLLQLGASVAIAEIDGSLERPALSDLAHTGAFASAMFVRADVSDETSVQALVGQVESRFGRVDVVLNNAAYSPAGMAVVETPVEGWDRSYAVNLRGPALLARFCLPAMVARKHGVFTCVSSTGGPFLAPYETLKAAQLTLANSLDVELEGTGVVAFTIGPGLVATKTAIAAIEHLAPRLGMTPDDFWARNLGAVVSVEAAGAGFAASIALAERYSGQEISSTQALIDAGIEIPTTGVVRIQTPAPSVDASAALAACRQVHKTLDEQVDGWKERSFFERQWMLRDFKHRVGMPVERCIEMFAGLERRLESGRDDATSADTPTLMKLSQFYVHLGDLARGYVKDPAAREEQIRMTARWRNEVDRLVKELGGRPR